MVQYVYSMDYITNYYTFGTCFHLQNCCPETFFILYIHVEIPNLGVEDILQWLTGSRNIPPLGFPKKIRCQFLHGCPPGCKCRPTTSTCDLVITVPVHLNTEDNTKEILTSAFMDCIGFGLL